MVAMRRRAAILAAALLLASSCAGAPGAAGSPSIADQYLAFECYPGSGLLAQRDDGHAIRPGPGFAPLVGTTP